MNESKLSTIHALLVAAQYTDSDEDIEESLLSIGITSKEVNMAYNTLTNEGIITLNMGSGNEVYIDLASVDDDEETTEEKETTPWGEYALYFIICIAGGILYAYST